MTTRLKYNTINYQIFETHLADANVFFPKKFPKEAYIKKLLENAIIIELWDQNKIIGINACYINHPTSSIAYISHIDILPQYRKQGFGRMLINESVRMAVDKGFTFIQLEVQKENHNAISFYKKLGFTLIEERESKYLISKKIV